jgi:hypothetical protein
MIQIEHDPEIGDEDEDDRVTPSEDLCDLAVNALPGAASRVH